MFSSRGGTPPPHVADLYPCPPWGLSVTIPFLLIPLLFLYRLRLCPALYGLVVLLVLFSPYVVGGGLWICLPISPFSTTSFPPPLLPLLPLPLDPWMFRACCGWVAGAWPLVGPPPGGKLTIWATIARVCSPGIPLPPSWLGAPPPTPSLGCSYPLAPSSPPIFIEVGGGSSSGPWP